jgi:hypothetical protein
MDDPNSCSVRVIDLKPFERHAPARENVESLPPEQQGHAVHAALVLQSA